MNVIDSKEFAKLFYLGEVERTRNPEKYRGLMTGIPELDGLGGFMPGWYSVIGGPEKGGKTALMLSMLGIQASRYPEKRAGYFSAEMMNNELAMRMFANVAGISMNKFLTVSLDGDPERRSGDWAALGRAHDRICDWNVVWADGVMYIEEVVEAAMDLDLELIYVDYLQLLSSKKRTQNRTGEISQISHTCQALAKRSGRPRNVNAGSQMDRLSVKGKNFTSANGYLGSGDIERDADFALNIFPVVDEVTGEEEENLREVAVTTSRWTKKVNFFVAWAGDRSLVGGSTVQKVDLNVQANQYLDEKIHI